MKSLLVNQEILTKNDFKKIKALSIFASANNVFLISLLNTPHSYKTKITK